MANYKERLDEILTDHREWMRGIRTDRLVGTSSEATKQAITSLIKELVAEAKPPVIDMPSRLKIHAEDYRQMFYDMGQNDTIARFEQNLLKALSKEN